MIGIGRPSTVVDWGKGEGRCGVSCRVVSWLYPGLSGADPTTPSHHQVSAVEKNSGKSQTITITSEKGRLSEDEIERMVRGVALRACLRVRALMT